MRVPLAPAVLTLLALTSAGEDGGTAEPPAVYSLEGKTRLIVEVPEREEPPPPEPPPPPRKAELEERTIRTLEPVYFGSKEVDLLPASEAVLDAVAEIMIAHPDIRVLHIEAHTDSMPSNNLKLSERRAQAVQAYLVKKGVDPSRLSARGHGASRPIASNATREGRSANRRVEFIVER